MKKITLVAALLLVLSLTACSDGESDYKEVVTLESEQEKSGETANKEEGSSSDKGKRVRLSFDGGEAIILLNDSAAGEDLKSLLPLYLDFEDFAGEEKISYLPKELSKEGAPDGYDPEIGDITLYAPWGNMAIFYEDHGYSEGLVPLGHVETGLESLARMGKDFKATMELVEE